jgi:hypothetical protein
MFDPNWLGLLAFNLTFLNPYDGRMAKTSNSQTLNGLIPTLWVFERTSPYFIKPLIS